MVLIKNNKQPFHWDFAKRSQTFKKIDDLFNKAFTIIKYGKTLYNRGMLLKKQNPFIADLETQMSESTTLNAKARIQIQKSNLSTSKLKS